MKTFLKTFSFFMCLIVTDFAQAQNVKSEIHAHQPTLEDMVTKGRNRQTDVRFLTFAIENDLFASGKDQYYTNGVRLSYFDAGMDLPQWAKKMGELYPGFKLNETTSLALSIGQNLYTPRDISNPNPQPNDRPWAAWLYGSAGMVSVTHNHVDEIELSLGVVGPAALGKHTQKFVHNHISDSPDPKGWKHQLDNEFGLNFAWDRRWPQYFSMQSGENLWFSAAPSIALSVGNIYTHAETGLNFRLSPSSERISDLPLRVRPAMPGTGYFPKPNNDFSWSIFGGVNSRLVGRNIFLDGNTFENSPSVDKKHFVYDLNAGFDITYGQSRLSYTLVRRSKEFTTQDDASIFGAISLSRRF